MKKIKAWFWEGPLEKSATNVGMVGTVIVVIIFIAALIKSISM